MSFGLTPYDFVQQVYYVQEGVILDYWPSDDKYKEIIMQGNLILEELQKEEDWNWLRERITFDLNDECHDKIPELNIPNWVYKPSTKFGDCCLIWPDHRHMDDERFAIKVPFISSGQLHKQRVLLNGQVDNNLYAVMIGDIITFNKPSDILRHGIMAIDIQRRMIPMHICDDNCIADTYFIDDPDNPGTQIPCHDISYEPDNYHPCNKIEDKVFEEIPDPNYMIYRTAATHAMYSPPAQARAYDLTQTAQKILSAMRQNDAFHTTPDIIEYAPIDYVEVC